MVPHPVEVNLKPIESQKIQNFFDNNKFSFLFIFSYHSSIERKNPFFLIEAFSKAFSDNDDVELVIKTSGAEKYKQSERSLHQFAATKNNIKIFNVDLDKNSVSHLINDSDCYVSMHHSEGFGLTLAEAMSLGKPTVATNYSGNTEFMNENNSFLVDFELGAIVNPDINFSSKTIWANPLLHDAINKLKEVYENKVVRGQKATNAKLYVKEKLSFDTVGSIMKDRLNYIYNNLEDLSINDRRQAYLLNQLQQAKSEIAQLQREIRRMKKNVVIKSVLVIKDSVRTLKGNK
ncbi:glycosyltransferase [uncultured Flavobacterium sp.]|uniref:glycosyltransferase n=1 Tax=uncultured Flavobacterium sp. TaxID=165435 RepID=UPI002624F722|nr:glycosyltransferase [uncultured Flavobacterium sp.]